MKTFPKLLIVIFFFSQNIFFASAYVVKNLKATYSNGQVFLKWTTPASTNLKYNVYRSTTKFTSTSQLNSSTLIGNVRDSSCKNFRLSQILGGQRYFKTDNAGTTMAANKGLYVFTCLDNQSYFYCVTVTKLSNNVETKKINDGKNNLKTAIAESIANPQPVLQDSVTWGNDEQVLYYAWFVNNVDAPNFPAMCSQGSYGFNFYLIKRGNATTYPIFAFYEGLQENSLKGNGIDSFKNVTNCYILG
ncbi:MAG: hypothetical protein LH473_09445, partial [Chitinophagales bacterium]|nr:hypothetical protein [Chitinophagales bacterium]